MRKQFGLPTVCVRVCGCVCVHACVRARPRAAAEVWLAGWAEQREDSKCVTSSKVLASRRFQTSSVRSAEPLLPLATSAAQERRGSRAGGGGYFKFKVASSATGWCRSQSFGCSVESSDLTSQLSG